MIPGPDRCMEGQAALPEATASHGHRVYVVVVNYGPGWDTIECLESLLRCRHANREVVVCDNGPGDTAARLIRAWAEGKVDVVPQGGAIVRRLCTPPMPKPVPYSTCADIDIEAGRAPSCPSASLVLITSRKNRGFAGGANLGLRYALSRGDADFFWLLNNDTVVDSEALPHLLEVMDARSRLGICGSTLAYFHCPGVVQARGGGRYDRWCGRTSLTGTGDPTDRARSGGMTPLDFIHGASMLVRRAFVEQVGLLDERYFLYFEELDWITRARGRFELGHAPASLVFHKEGGAAGSATVRPRRRSYFADYHGIRSRILFTRRFYPYALPTVYLGLFGAVLNRVVRGQWDRIPMILKLMLRAG